MGPAGLGAIAQAALPLTTSELATCWQRPCVASAASAQKGLQRKQFVLLAGHRMNPCTVAQAGANVSGTSWTGGGVAPSPPNTHLSDGLEEIPSLVQWACATSAAAGIAAIAFSHEYSPILVHDFFCCASVCFWQVGSR